MSRERIAPENLPQGSKVIAMIGNVYCVRARVGKDINWNWVAEPTAYAMSVLAGKREVLPWRYLDRDDEGVFWVRGWSRKSANALKTAAALALT